MESYISQYNEQHEQGFQPIDVITKWLRAKKHNLTNKENPGSDKPFHLHLKAQLEAIKQGRRMQWTSLKKRRLKKMNEFMEFFNGSSSASVSTSVKLFLLLTVLSLAPSILILMTSFTRIIIVLSFVRTSLATQQMPPNQVLVGLSLFLTFFIMAPTFSEVNKEALTPLFNDEINLEEAYERACNTFQRVHEFAYEAERS